MITYKILAAAFIFLIPAFSYIIVNVANLQRYKLNLADFSLPLYALQIVLVSSLFFNHSLLPHYLVLMSLLSIILIIRQWFTRPTFSARRYLKLFWRAGFLLTAFFYILTVIAVFVV